MKITLSFRFYGSRAFAESAAEQLANTLQENELYAQPRCDSRTENPGSDFATHTLSVQLVDADLGVVDTVAAEMAAGFRTSSVPATARVRTERTFATETVDTEEDVD